MDRATSWAIVRGVPESQTWQSYWACTHTQTHTYTVLALPRMFCSFLKFASKIIPLRILTSLWASPFHTSSMEKYKKRVWSRSLPFRVSNSHFLFFFLKPWDCQRIPNYPLSDQSFCWTVSINASSSMLLAPFLSVMLSSSAISRTNLTIHHSHNLSFHFDPSWAWSSLDHLIPRKFSASAASYLDMFWTLPSIKQCSRLFLSLSQFLHQLFLQGPWFLLGRPIFRSQDLGSWYAHYY